MYTLADVYKTFPSGCTEEYKILRAFEMGKQEGGAKVKELKEQIEKMKSDVISERDEARRLEDTITYVVLNNILAKWGVKEK